MARAIWKGSIAFGLVNIPIELHTAVHDHRPHFRMLHATDKSPVRFERVCIKDGTPVAWTDLVKGFEYAKGRFVVMTKEDFRAAAVEKTRTVDIIDFVKADEIDDRFFETPYYLLPAKGADHAYVVLREAMREAGRVGVARVILRDVQHLAAIEVIEDALVLTLMRFSDELADVSAFAFPKAGNIHKAELEMAKSLVKSLDAPWDASKYTDQYRDNLMRVIRGKAKGTRVRLQEDEPRRRADVVDLMERLQKSLDRSKKSAKRKRSRHAA